MPAPAEERGSHRKPASGRAPEPAQPRVEPATAEAESASVDRPPAAVSTRVAQRLQGSVGNRAVAALLAPRGRAAARRSGDRPARPATSARPATPGRPAAGPPAVQTANPTAASAAPTSAPPTGGTTRTGPSVQRFVPDSAAAGAGDGRRPGPHSDPKFTALTTDVRAKQQQLTAHRPAQAEAAAAAGAAVPPQDSKEAYGKAANADKMNAAKPGEFDKAAFVRAVNQAIAAQAPKDLDEADKFAESGKADAVKTQVAGQVGAGRQQSAAAIESTTQAPPDTAAVREKPVDPLRPDQPPPTPGPPDPARAVPDPAPPAATDLSAGPRQVDQQMADAEVTEPQLANANEPEFGAALTAKKDGEAHAATAPGQLRAAEAQTLTAARAQAGQVGAAAMGTMATDRRQAGAAVGAGKTEAKSSDEANRAKVTATLQKVFDATKKDVEDILTGLDRKVGEKFDTEEKAARDAFTAEHKRRMDAYKDERYSGLLGAGRWLRDKFAGLPAEANQIFVTARAGYVSRMQQVISGVADLIGTELGRAKQRIAKGRADLQAEVATLPKELQALGKQAAGEFAGRFDELTEAVTSKGQELVQTLATKYSEALGKVDDEIAAEKEKNKGLVDKAMDAVAGVVRTILELKNLLLGVLAKAASAVLAIIKDPISFLGKLVSAVGAGLHAFIANIGAHLKKGLLGWLLGAMSGAGLQLPAKFDLRGILGMIGSLLGLTWGAIRGRIVSRGVPEQAMGAVEQSVPVAQKLQSEGVAGIWTELSAKLGDLKANLFEKITKYLIPTVLIAGITWIVSLLNPASAFIKACKMIVDIVTFIIERGAQIVAFVNAVLDAVIAIAGGGAGGVPALIENALALSIPVLIGALAAILGISGIAEKVKKIFQSLAKPVMKAVDWVVDKLVKFGKKIWSKLKSKFARKQKGQPAGPVDPARERAAIADAERLLAGNPTHGAVAGQLPAMSRRHGLPLRLVTESRDPQHERVHVQTMSTESHDLPPSRDPELLKLDALVGQPRTDSLCTQLGEPAVIALIGQISQYGVQKLITGISDGDVKTLLGQLDPALVTSVFKGRQPATGPEFKRLFDQFGTADVNLLATALGGKLAQILRWDMFHLDSAQQAAIGSGHGATARSLPPLEGMTVAHAQAALTAAGMTLSASKPDQELWVHTDHSVVRLKTGPAAHGIHTPFNHAVLEVTKTAGSAGINDVYAKFEQGGQPIPQGTKQAQDQLAAWFKKKAGRAPDPGETAAMMNMWGKVGHIRLV